MRWMLAASAILASGAAYAGPALPTGGVVASGSATIGAPVNGALTVNQSSDKAILNWSTFSVGQGGTVNFNNGAGATLNRVTGSASSAINGQLNATGSVYLINPDGVVVGKTGVVNVGKNFVASTLNTSDAQFNAGGPLTLSGNSQATVVNYGRIGSLGGDIALVARTATNAGTITAPKGSVGVLAGSQVTLRDSALDDGKFSVDVGSSGDSATNSGTIQAADAELKANGGNIYALAGNTNGMIAATGTSSSGGKVFLTAGGGDVSVSGTITAQSADGAGGQVTARGANISVGGTVDASATASGKTGGRVSVIGTGDTSVLGTIDARGNAASGGTIETSGHTLSAGNAHVDAGQGGEWLLDPTDLIVDSTLAGEIDTSLNAGTSVTLTTSSSASPTTTPAYALTSGETHASGTGDIDINSALSWNTAATLTLNAVGNIAINSSIGASSGALVLNAANQVTAPAAVNVGIFTLQSGTWMQIAGTLPSFSATQQFNLGGAFLRFTGGDGSGGNPYQIADVYGLQAMNTMLSVSYKLVNNIDASVTSGWYGGAGFIPVGTDGNGNSIGAFGVNSVRKGFNGSLNGQGFTVNNLTIHRGNEVGLFGALSGSVSNIGVVGASISGNTFVGALVGINGAAGNTAFLTNDYATGTVSGSLDVGGLVGWNGFSIASSYSSANVSGTTNVGGLAGISLDSDSGHSPGIQNDFATGAVTGTANSQDVGGLVGFNQSDNILGSSTVSSSYALGPVSAGSGSSNIGGLIGRNSTVTGASFPTGAVNSYWDTSTTGQSASAGGGTGLTTAQLSAALPTGFSSSVWANGNNQVTPFLVGLSGQSVYVGSGSAGLFTVILSASGLQTIDNNLAGHYVLGANIDASATSQWNSGAGFVPLGTDGAGNVLNGGSGFSGILDGLGYTIDNLAVARNVNYTGLFGFSSGTIRNLGVVGGAISNGAEFVGGVAGESTGTISNVFATDAVSGVEGVAGLVGFNNSGSITNAYATGAVSGHKTVGALVGNNTNGTITNVYATGNVTAVGSGSSFIGALMGFVSGGTVTNAYWDSSMNAQPTSAAGTGLTTAQLQATLPSGFSNTVWGTGSGLYPYLLATYPTGPQVISGTAYSDAGSTPLGSAAIGLDANGSLFASTTTGASGYYYVTLAPGGSVNGTNVLAYVSGTPSATLLPGGLLTQNLNLYGNTLTLTTGATSLSAARSTAAAVAANDTSGTAALSGATDFNLIATGASFTVDQALNAPVETITTTAAGSALTVTAAMPLSGSNSLTLNSGGTLAINVPITATSASLTLDAVGTISDANAVNVGIFTLEGGAWTQNPATGPDAAFAAANFVIAGGSFLRAVGGGDGSSGNPYQVTDIYGLQGIGSDRFLLADSWELANNIDASSATSWNGGKGFVPLGMTSAGNFVPGDPALLGDASGFVGTFNGQGFTVDNLTINRPNFTNVGLFGWSTGTIENVGVVGGTITGAGEVGGLVGGNFGSNGAGIVTNSYAAVTVVGVGGLAGGLVGDSNGTISNSYATGTVTGSGELGGLVGVNDGAISVSYATGAVSGTSTQIGGLVGAVQQGTITNTFATGAVTGSSQVGGLVGQLQGTISNSYATGSVTGTSSLGGLVGAQGIHPPHSVTDSFWDVSTTGRSTSAVGGTGLTTSQFFNALPGTFDSTVWGTGPDLYPYLKVFFPNGQQAVSGAAYSDGAQTIPLASGTGGAVTIGLDAGGSYVSSATTGANGYYYFALPAGTIASGAPLMTYVSGASAATFAIARTVPSDGTQTENVNLTSTALRGNTNASSFSAALTVAANDPAGLSAANSAPSVGLTASGSSFTWDVARSNNSSLSLDETGGTLIISAPVSSANGFNLNAVGAVDIDAALTVSGLSNTVIRTGTDTITVPGTSLTELSFGSGGSLDWAPAAHGSQLFINNTQYTLLYGASDIQGIDSDALLSGNYALANSIDATGVSGWVPVGLSAGGQAQNGGLGFAGTFEGLGNTISNLTVNAMPTGNSAMFGYTSGTIRDLTLASVTINATGAAGALATSTSGKLINDVVTSGTIHGGSYVGGLVGQVKAGSVLVSDRSAASVLATGARVGGLGGWNAAGATIVGSSASGHVSGFDQTGGLIGWNDGSISNSSASGEVTGSDYAAGGLVGYNTGAATLSSVYATGTVDGTAGGEGGLVGYNLGSVTNAYAIGNVGVATTHTVGGLIGNNSGGHVIDVYAAGHVTGAAVKGALFGANGATATLSNGYYDALVTGTLAAIGNNANASVHPIALNASLSPTAQSSYTGFDFSAIWMIASGQMPMLKNVP